MIKPEVNKMTAPLVSIIVPTYNNEKYLAVCLDSLLAQTFQDFEIIVIDDGSTNQTTKILEAYKTNPHVQIHTQPNSGISAARNQGLKLSRGKFLGFVDSDDRITPDFLEKLITPLLQNPNIDISVCGYQEIYQDHKVSHPLQSRVVTGIEATKNFLLEQRDFDILIWNKLCRKSLFDDHAIRYPVGQIHEDNLTTYKLFAAAKSVQYLKDELYFYQRKNSYITKNYTSTEKTLKRLEAKEQMAEEARKYLNTSDFNLVCDIAKILAYFAFIDNSITRHIDQKYFGEYRNKALQALKSNRKNPYLTRKLRLYQKLLSSPRGVLYRIFRKITLKSI